MKKQGTEPPVTNFKWSPSQIVGYCMILKGWKICCASKVMLKSTLQVPLVAALGFEPTALGVCQATNAVLQYHSEGKAGGKPVARMQEYRLARMKSTSLKLVIQLMSRRPCSLTMLSGPSWYSHLANSRKSQQWELYRNSVGLFQFFVFLRLYKFSVISLRNSSSIQFWQPHALILGLRVYLCGLADGLK